MPSKRSQYRERVHKTQARHKRQPGGTSVRCLGPGAEHSFASPDPARVRVCDRCRRLVDEANPSMRDLSQNTVYNGD